MSGAHLQSFQAAFAAALVDGDPAARPCGLAGAAGDRFRVYRNTFFHGVGQQLGEAYPAVRRIVGDEFFFATARAFLEAHPPRTRSLALFGGEFPGFLADFPPAASLPYLADVARLERARLEALHAADATPLSPAALAGLAGAPSEVRFVAHPAARIVTSGYPIVDLWQANRPEAAPGPRKIEAVAQGALITRPRLEVEVHPLTPAQADFARAVLTGRDAATAHDAAIRRTDTFNVTTAFRRLLTAGAFAETDHDNGSTTR